MRFSFRTRSYRAFVTLVPRASVPARLCGANSRSERRGGHVSAIGRCARNAGLVVRRGDDRAPGRQVQSGAFDELHGLRFERGRSARVLGTRRLRRGQSAHRGEVRVDLSGRDDQLRRASGRLWALLGAQREQHVGRGARVLRDPGRQPVRMWRAQGRPARRVLGRSEQGTHQRATRAVDRSGPRVLNQRSTPPSSLVSATNFL